SGDIAELPELAIPCRCGRAGRVVKSIDGRIEDYVITADGTKIGRLDHIFKDMINIKEAQVAQDCVDTVVFRIVRGARYSERDERLLLQEARQRLGSAIDIQLAYVDSLSRTETHKLRFVVSTLPQGRV